MMIAIADNIFAATMYRAARFRNAPPYCGPTRAPVARVPMGMPGSSSAAGSDPATPPDGLTWNEFRCMMWRCGIDAFVIGGLTLFGAFTATGGNELDLVVRSACYTAGITAGLTFFNGLRQRISKHDAEEGEGGG